MTKGNALVPDLDSVVQSRYERFMTENPIASNFEYQDSDISSDSETDLADWIKISKKIDNSESSADADDSVHIKRPADGKEQLSEHGHVVEQLVKPKTFISKTIHNHDSNFNLPEFYSRFESPTCL